MTDPYGEFRSWILQSGSALNSAARCLDNIPDSDRAEITGLIDDFLTLRERFKDFMRRVHRTIPIPFPPDVNCDSRLERWGDYLMEYRRRVAQESAERSTWNYGG